MSGIFKAGVCWILCMLLGVAVALAENRYVSEDFEITMRTGPGLDHKIISLIPSGREVELVKEGEEWSEIRLANGKEGYVLTRYLTQELPTALKLERLQRKYSEVVDKNKTLEEKIAELTSGSRTVGTELRQTQETLNKVQSDYDALKKDSANFLKFKKTYEKNLKELDEARTRADKFENEFNKLANSQLYEGLLYGGGLVFLGLIIGFILKKPKRRSGLM